MYIIPDQYPPPGTLCALRRNNLYFTATPCYGMHKPWWIVRTLGEFPYHEVNPVDMKDEDLWQEITSK